MSIFQKFGASVAGAALVATAVTTSVALPEVAEAQTIRQPESCRLLEREYSRQANDQRRIEQQASRDVGRSVNDTLRGRNRSGSTGGNILGSVLGGVAQIQVPKIFGGGQRNLARLEEQCAVEREMIQDGVCRNQTRERGSVDTANGRVVGSARGRIDESRDCTSQTYGNPGNRTLTDGGRGAGGAIARERDLQDSGQLSRGGVSTGRDFSKCAIGTKEMVCPTANGGVERIPLASVPGAHR
jgi:hypothetical protein